MTDQNSLWGPVTRVLDRACTYYSDRTALIAGDRSLTYTELRSVTNRIANGLLALGITPGERVGLLMPNILEFVPTQYGIWKSGAVPVQMAAKASAEDHRYFLTESGATTLIYHASFDATVAALADQVPTLRRLIRLGEQPGDSAADYYEIFGTQDDSTPPVDIGPGDPAQIMFTSGSTGTPKGVLFTHDRLSHYLLTAGLEIGDTRPGEVFAHGAPLTHFTQIFLLPTFLRGGANVIMPGLDVDTLLDTIVRHRATATAVVPTVIYLMLTHPKLAAADLSSLGTVIYAGSPMAPEKLRTAIEALGPVFIQTYAGTEPGFISCLRKQDHMLDDPAALARLGSAGRPLFHVDVSIQDEQDRHLPVGETGEICARQLGRMSGYLDSGKDTEALRDGWVHSGDIGYLDADGYLFLVDRKKDLVVTGGFNVFPRQVEDVLTQHAAVAQCAVIGIPHPKWGEAVHAVVVPKPGHTVTAEQLIALVKAHKGSVWAPKTLDFVDTLPLNASGKVDKKALRAPYWAGHARQVN
ncbi:MAG: Long-chain fatty acid--CoA ligase [Nocardia sp.]|uniref:AMP-binding protein n=1 Tax=Nocardia sp. TaxID=1821 RepID=UPI002632D11F|nr:AMP-binding protein [Nocardia sp.]MCU1643923.1 Long-chain fatty acid--CoA ligase [Nocardia sp.]